MISEEFSKMHLIFDSEGLTFQVSLNFPRIVYCSVIFLYVILERVQCNIIQLVLIIGEELACSFNFKQLIVNVALKILQRLCASNQG